MHGRFALTVIYCADLEPMAAFYRDTLGLKVIAEKEGEYVLDGNSHALLLQARPDRPTREAETIFIGVDVETAVQDLAALDPVRMPGEESRGFRVQDPEGNSVCFVND
ncbi:MULTISPECIES: VOC family protein [unclassified Streptomyces]|uniref:VOC family protein n=1 Tax=unclassified Streptomyces TaxID=2593676 RepID=UPI00278C44B1|nr:MULTISPECIES: VOC family protein [unclassified Streptomyces]